MDLPTALIEYIDLVLQKKQVLEKFMVEASYTTCTHMIS